MIVLGVVLVLLGWGFGIGLLITLGIIALVIGAVLAIAGGLGHAIGGRRWYY